MQPHWKRLFWVALVVAFITSLGFFGGWMAGASRSAASEVALTEDLYDTLAPLIKTMALIRNDYVDVDKTKTQSLVYGALKGMVTELDPYSAFMDPPSYKDMQDDTRGSFGGLGIEIGMRNSQLTIVAPIDNTPAQRAGLQSGDEIMKIDGEATDGLSIMDAVHKMRGPQGTKVTLTIHRRTLPEWFDVRLVRDIIKTCSVRSEMLTGNLGYIRITEFVKFTNDDLQEDLEKLQRQGLKGLILDLRNNPGGLLDVAVKVAENFVPQGKLIVYTVGRHPERDLRFVSTETLPTQGIPLAVLINEGSASASEILAGAIQDQQLGLIVGEKSFGKGSVQTVIPLGDGSGLRITTARYLTPKGQMIHGNGITPDLQVEPYHPNELTLRLQADKRFEDFALYYLRLHPRGEEVPAEPVNKIEVSESSWKKLRPQSMDDKLRDSLLTWLKEQKAEVSAVAFAQDQTFILNRVRQELAQRLSGQQAARKLQIEGDPQVQRAEDALKIWQMEKK